MLLVLTVTTAGETPLAAEARFSAIRELIAAGDYPRAEVQALELRKTLQVSPGQTSDLSQATDLLVEALWRNGRGAEESTRILAEEALQGRIAQAGPDDLAIVPSLRNLGEVLSNT